MVKTEKDIKVVRVSEETQQMAAINILLDGERKRRSAARKKTGDQTWEVALSKDVFDRICQKERKVVLADFQRQWCRTCPGDRIHFFTIEDPENSMYAKITEMRAYQTVDSMIKNLDLEKNGMTEQEARDGLARLMKTKESEQEGTPMAIFFKLEQ